MLKLQGELEEPSTENTGLGTQRAPKRRRKGLRPGLYHTSRGGGVGGGGGERDKERLVSGGKKANRISSP